MNIKKSIVLALLLFNSGCSWVDSTGEQSGDNSVSIDSTIVTLDASDSFSIEENTQRTIVFNGTDSRATNWDWNLLEGQANIGQCQGINGFDQAAASNSLSQTCADIDNCQINIKEVVLNNITRFEITTPHMRAPAALEFSFTTQADSGVFLEQRQTLCAIPINNPPTAVDDLVVVTRGSRLEVDGDSTQSLLANDTDDIDIRNQELQIDRTPVSEPRFATSFELFPDGGFIYEPNTGAPISVDGSVSDSFTYMVSDGNETSTATVSIKISAFNSAPEQIDAIEDIEIMAEDSDSDIEIAFLQSYFRDSENDVLEFSVLDDSLPASGNITLTDDGVLEGFATEDDSGLFLVNMTVSDNLESIETEFFLAILNTRAQNISPTVTDIDNESVSADFSYDVSVFFTDLDDDYLYFTSTPLPEDVEITAQGVITGTASSENRGTWLIRVQADDGNGGTTDDGFRLTIL